MKKLAIIASLLLAVVALTACNDKKEEVVPEPSAIDKAIDGVWHLQSFAGEQPSASGLDIYIKFSKLGTFVIYQKGVNHVRYVKFEGTFSIVPLVSVNVDDGTVIADNVYNILGEYSNGEAWGNVYSLTIDSEHKQLTLTNNAEASDVSIYAREEYIPASVLANLAADSRADGEEEIVPFL